MQFCWFHEKHESCEIRVLFLVCFPSPSLSPPFPFPNVSSAFPSQSIPTSFLFPVPVNFPLSLRTFWVPNSLPTSLFNSLPSFLPVLFPHPLLLHCTCHFLLTSFTPPFSILATLSFLFPLRFSPLCSFQFRGGGQGERKGDGKGRREAEGEAKGEGKGCQKKIVWHGEGKLKETEGNGERRGKKWLRSRKRTGEKGEEKGVVKGKSRGQRKIK